MHPKPSRWLILHAASEALKRERRQNDRCQCCLPFIDLAMIGFKLGTHVLCLWGKDRVMKGKPASTSRQMPLDGAVNAACDASLDAAATIHFMPGHIGFSRVPVWVRADSMTHQAFLVLDGQLLLEGCKLLLLGLVAVISCCQGLHKALQTSSTSASHHEICDYL